MSEKYPENVEPTEEVYSRNPGRRSVRATALMSMAMGICGEALGGLGWCGPSAAVIRQDPDRPKSAADLDKIAESELRQQRKLAARARENREHMNEKGKHHKDPFGKKRKSPLKSKKRK